MTLNRSSAPALTCGSVSKQPGTTDDKDHVGDKPTLRWVFILMLVTWVGVTLLGRWILSLSGIDQPPAPIPLLVGLPWAVAMTNCNDILSPEALERLQRDLARPKRVRR